MSATDSEGFLLHPAPPPAYRLGAYDGDALDAAHNDAEDAPCSTCGGSPEDPRHGSKYHASEVRDQHEYEAAEPRCTCRPSPTRELAKAVKLPWWFGSMDCPVHGGKE